MTYKIGIIIPALILLCLSSVKSAPKYTENEKLALEQFRPVVKSLLYREYMNDDAYLIRWLRAKGMNIQEAGKMLKENVKWRHVNRMDSILQEEIFSFDRPIFHTDGIDVSGSPVGTFMPARMDVRRQVMTGKRNQTVRYWDQFLELGEVGIQSFASNNSDVTQGTIIFDFLGYSIPRHGCLPCLTTYFDWIKHYEHYYPGLCKELIFINIPRVFLPLLDMLKEVMSKETLRVLKVFGTNKEEWVSYLDKFISLDQRIQQLGGTLTE